MFQVGNTKFFVGLDEHDGFSVYKNKGDYYDLEDGCSDKEELLECLLSILLSEKDTMEDTVCKVKIIVNAVDQCVNELRAIFAKRFLEELEALG